MVDWIGIILILGGILTRLATWRRYVDAYAAAYGSAPPRTWLLARDPNPRVERARLPLAAGSIATLIGFVVYLIGLLSG